MCLIRIPSNNSKFRLKTEHITFDLEPCLFWIHSLWDKTSSSPHSHCKNLFVPDSETAIGNAYYLIDLTRVTSSYTDSVDFGITKFDYIYTKKQNNSFWWYAKIPSGSGTYVSATH